MMAPQLKVYAPAEPPPAVPTLRSVWRENLLPRKRRSGVKESTEGFYTRALDTWDGFLESPTPGGRDTLPVQQGVSWIDDAALQAYQDYLLSISKGARTVNSHLDSIVAILKAAASQKLIGQAPEPPEKLEEGEPDPIQFTMEELDALYEACRIAKWPRRLGRQPDGRRPALPYPASDGWRFALVWYFNYGFRPGELMPQKADSEPVEWKQVSLDSRSPAPSGKAECEHGWFWYTPPKQRRKKPKKLILPLTATTRQHLELLRIGATPDRSRPILDWPRGNKQMRDQWAKIVEESGVQMKPDLETGELQPVLLRHMRSTCSSWLDQHEPGISPYIVGHAPDRNPQTNVLVRGGTKVSGRHYVRMENAVLEALQTFPQPAAFTRGPEPRMRQQRLFD